MHLISANTNTIQVLLYGCGTTGRTVPSDVQQRVMLTYFR